VSVRLKPIRGVEIRERRSGEVRYAYRARFQNARGERKGRTFDCAEDALDFRARLRLPRGQAISLRSKRAENRSSSSWATTGACTPLLLCQAKHGNCEEVSRSPLSK
jgi:hypothetical protein